MSGPACAYLVSRYPHVTHTFVVGEVVALRRTGVRVETASVRRVDESQWLSELHREEGRRTHALLPAPPARLLAAHATAFLRSPKAYVRTLRRALRMAPEGGRPRLWQLFYFGESMLLWRWMRGRKVSHVHVHHGNVSSDVALLACEYADGWTWSVTLHGPTELMDVASHKLPQKVADASAVVCISDFARSQVYAFCAPEDRAKVEVVRCGIEVGSFTPPRAPRRDGSTDLQILCVGALSRRKGHAVLLDAMALLRDRGSDVRLVLAGDGDERADLEAQAARLGIADRVDFLGAVGHDRLPEHYARADLFCLPSFAEGVPTVLMEAMATELPVVTTRIAGTPELVEHERSGLLVPPARADLLAGALQQLVEDAALRTRLGKAGREKVLAEYASERSAERLRQVLLPLL